jgi:predicted acetyltransferase
MNVALVEAPPAAEPVLERLMQLYAYDFSEFMHSEVGEDGRFSGGTPIASCWREPWRHAYLIRAAPVSGEGNEGRIAGFTMVDEQSRLTGDRSVSDVAEFFVLRRYRRLGVGLQAATAAFCRFPGRWEVRQTAANTAATAFWRKAIAAHTGGDYTETWVDDARWRGPVQAFVSIRRNAFPV